MESTARTNERVVDGVAHGLIGEGQTVTFEARHFGLRMRHTSRISLYESPHHFQDRMVKGMFQSFVHDHWFEEVPETSTTVMTDELRFSAPFGPIGLLAERIVLKSHLRRFLEQRNQLIRSVAESDRWRRYIE